MSRDEENLKYMLDEGRKILTQYQLHDELNLYCKYYIDKGFQPAGILFSEISKEEFGYIAFTDSGITVLHAKMGLISGTRYDEPKKILYSNIRCVEAKGDYVLHFQFTNGSKYKLNLLTAGTMFIILRIFEKLSQNVVFYNNIRNFDRVKEMYQ